jgi:hypothetical protein
MRTHLVESTISTHYTRDNKEERHDSYGYCSILCPVVEDGELVQCCDSLSDAMGARRSSESLVQVIMLDDLLLLCGENDLPVVNDTPLILPVWVVDFGPTSIMSNYAVGVRIMVPIRLLSGNPLPPRSNLGQSTDVTALPHERTPLDNQMQRYSML